MQRRECVIGLDLAQVGHALCFDERALARQALQNPPDDLRQQGLQLIAGGCTRFMEHRSAFAAAIDAVEHETQMYVEIGGGAKALDQGDRTGVRFAAFEPCL